MDIFDNTIDSTINLLPKDGVVNYYGPILSLCNSDKFFHDLLKVIDWKNDEAVILGNKIVTKRKVAWYGDRPFSYTYSKTTKEALPWCVELLQLKEMVESLSEESFNSCLLNLYHDGNEGMTWHSDGETELKLNGAIASLSLGAERKFSFKHKKTKEIVSLVLEHGSLLVMKSVTQTHWLHCLPTTKKIGTARINLTFRMIENKSKTPSP
jgi:alkylated DNA repair dioxygenase AlkB